MFTEYSMTDPDIYEEYTGFTEEEVKELCERFDMDFSETSNWYDGYMFTKFRHIYNPKSVVEAMHRRKFSNYWASTEVCDALKTYITMDFDGLHADIVRMLGGGSVRINTRSFRNDMSNFEVKDDVLTLLVHLGYLAYNYQKKEVFIPNKEIIEEFETAMSVKGWSEVMRVVNASEKLKYNKTVNAAIQQIKNRNYTHALERYTGEILLVGINYDRDKPDKPHECVIEKMEKNDISIY